MIHVGRYETNTRNIKKCSLRRFYRNLNVVIGVIEHDENLIARDRIYIDSDSDSDSDSYEYYELYHNKISIYENPITISVSFNTSQILE
jgi:hypothetical protein